MQLLVMVALNIVIEVFGPLGPFHVGEILDQTSNVAISSFSPPPLVNQRRVISVAVEYVDVKISMMVLMEKVLRNSSIILVSDVPLL